MDRNFLRTGIGYRINSLKQQHPDLYEKYKLVFAFFADEEVVYHSELTQISQEAANEILLTINPEIKEVSEGRMTPEEYMERIMKRVNITSTEE